jgi:hypothetical protein
LSHAPTPFFAFVIFQIGSHAFLNLPTYTSHIAGFTGVPHHTKPIISLTERKDINFMCFFIKTVVFLKCFAITYIIVILYKTNMEWLEMY